MWVPDGEVGDAAEVERFQSPADGVADLVDLDAVLAAFVAHHDDRRAVADPLRQPVPHPVGPAVLADGLFPQGHGEELPAGAEGDGVAGGMEGEVAEVTVGGVDTRQLSSKTMESRLVPGLYFIGEVVDVTGWLGGFNFQWAWASGHAAGEAA